MNKTDKKNLFDKQRRQLAQKYRREKNRNKWLNKFVQLLFWFVFLYFSYELKLYELVTDFVSGPEIQIFAYVFVFSFLFFLFNMLTGYFLSYRVERKYELSNQNSREWLKDSGKGFLLNLVIFYFAARVLLLLINLFPDFWWFYFSLIAAGFLVLITFVMPKVLLPLFFTLEKYPAGELRDRLMSFIAQLDIDIEEIYEINLSSKINYANAAVVGLAGTRKILLGDNLTERYSPEEIEAVLAHELAHHINGDIIKNLIFEPFFLLASFFVLNLIWPRVLDLFSYSETFVYTLPVMMVVWGIIYGVFTPLKLYITRSFEERADEFALNKISEPYNFASVMARLADESLQELYFSSYELLFEASHPAFGDRIEKALNYGDR